MTEKSETLRIQFEQLSTEELTKVLRNRDEDEWRPEAFEVVASVLKARGISPDEISALGPEGHDVLESAPTVTVATFFSPAEAHGSRMALEEAGISAWVADEALGTMYGVGVGARLQVRAQDAEAACEALAATASAEALPADLAEPPCPACGSQNVTPEAWVDETPTDGARWPRSRRKWYYVCGDCREAWPLGVA
jgi:hypothetical protein